MSRREPVAREWTPIILAIGLATAINCLTVAVLYDAIVSSTSGLSENATQILTTAFGGIIGVLGSALGFKQGSERADELADAEHGTSVGDRSPATVQTRGTTMSTTTPEPQQPQDPATDPDRSIEDQPQDPDATQPQSPDTEPHQ